MLPGLVSGDGEGVFLIRYALKYCSQMFVTALFYSG
jgi:hypothetical protein